MQRAAQAGATMVYTSASKPLNLRLVQAGEQLGFRPEWVFSSSTATPDFFTALGPSAKGLVFWFDNKVWTISGDPDVDTFTAAMKQYGPDVPINGNVVTTFSSLMTLKRLAEQVGADKITRADLAAAWKGMKPVEQFMGPELNPAVHLPGFPNAFHTGSYLYRWNGTGFEEAGNGFYRIAA